MRTDKFKYIMDSMANHRIDEANSEYSASFLSETGHQKNRMNSQTKNLEQYYNKVNKEHSTVEEEEDESRSSSRNNIPANQKSKKKNSKEE